MAKDTRINFAVAEETRQEWKEHADQHDEFQSMSDMIRTAVWNQIESESNQPTAPVPESVKIDGFDEEMTEMVQSLDSLARSIDSVRKDVERLRDEVDSDDSTVDMDRVLLSVIPEPDDLEPTETGVRADEVAQSIGAPVSETKEALDRLARDHPGVERMEEIAQQAGDPDGTGRFIIYRKEGK